MRSSGNGRGSYDNGRGSSGNGRGSINNGRGSGTSGRGGVSTNRGGVDNPGRGTLPDSRGINSNSGRGGVDNGRGGVTPGHGNINRGSVNHPAHHYARPGERGPLPPSHRPMHPAPYFHHPYHHHMIHMRPVVWVHVHPRPLYWPGFWVYCNSYWYDYHVTDVVVVNRYVRETYNVDMVSYAISGDLMYAIVNDVDGNTYLQVYDKNDRLLAEHQISRKYRKMEIDRENGGCWIFKRNDKDPMLFLYTDGELLIYEAD